MELTFGINSIFHSRLFTFRAGENGASTTVHSGAVAAISAPLKDLMEEETPDGKRTDAVLPNVREEDLLRFCDFCYTHTYTDPYPVVIKPAATPEPSASNALVTIEADKQDQEPPAKRPRTGSPAFAFGASPFGGSSFGKPGALAAPTDSVASTNKVKLHSVFPSGRVFGSTSTPNGTRNSSTIKLNAANEDHTSVLIAHAAMYTFAVRFEIATLKTLALQKLADKLTRMELFPQRIDDVMALVRYVYLMEKEVLPDMAELRDLVARYVVSETTVLGASDEFLGLLEEGGLFVRDFWALVHGSLL